MGIRGLTTYIHNHAELYLEPFDLHDTYLVIDGYSLSCQLYASISNTNCAFGGDYYKYVYFVREYFTNLLKCKVTPLVVLDGGQSHMKLATILQRTSKKIEDAEFYTPLNQKNLKLFPILLNHVFKDVLREMNIRHVQTSSEADKEIAALAKSLNCPVLSKDSDFFIYGVLYIPIDTLEIRPIRNRISCKIYKVSNLLKRFPGLRESMLPLLGILVGNDYIEYKTFIHFYPKIKIPKAGRLNFNKQQCLIEGILKWLSNYNMHTAIRFIMSTVPQTYKKQISETIQMILEEYANASVNVFYPLGFSKEEIEQITFQNKQNNSNLEMYDDYEKCHEMLQNQVVDKSRLESNFEAFINSLPTWFIEEYYKVNLPYYFIDVLYRHLIIGNVQIEDMSRPSSLLISTRIVEVICTLLTSGREDKGKYCEIVIRGHNGSRLVRHKLEYVSNIFSFNIPFIDKLREISFTIRKEIFDITLGVQEHITEFPFNWRLFIITVVYWINHLPDLKSDSHIYAILFTLLYDIINEKLGYFKSITKFYTKYQNEIKKLDSREKTKKDDVSSCSTNISITEALVEVTKDDCLLVAPFFITNSETNDELIRNPKKFRRSIVHVFSEFQACFKYTLDLNKLLGCVYEEPFMARFFWGTLLYNVDNNFRERKNIESYINSILQCSPTLLQLFNAILVKVKLMFKLRPHNK